MGTRSVAALIVEITVALTGFGIHVLPFRDPDNFQIELTAPIG